MYGQLFVRKAKHVQQHGHQHASEGKGLVALLDTIAPCPVTVVGLSERFVFVQTDFRSRVSVKMLEDLRVWNLVVGFLVHETGCMASRMRKPI